MRTNKKYIIVIIIILALIIWFAMTFIKVEGYTYPAKVISKSENSKIIVTDIYADDNKEIEINVSDVNVWNLIEAGKTYLLGYDKKIFHKEYDLDQILPMDQLPSE